MFRYKKSIPVSYEWQGYIYFTSLLYWELPKRTQEKILNLCIAAGKEKLPGAVRVCDNGRGRTGGLPAAPPLPLYVGTSRAEILRGVPTEDLTCRQPGHSRRPASSPLSMTTSR